MSADHLLERNTQLVYRLRSLAMAGTVLHIGAHPDDEDAGLLPYLTHKLGVRCVYWSATRGEGGQNRIGPDQQEALGVYRTWESLAARALDGGEALFGPFYDFGFSKSGEDTLAKWGGRDMMVREIVRAIRMVQPQIVISRWTGRPDDGHGHHQAVGAAVPEAFEAAGDARRFPELREQGLAAWQPRKLYYSTSGDWQPGEETPLFGASRPEFEQDGCVRVDTGEFDPVAGQTYQEQAWRAFNQHKTQGMGFVPSKGPFYYYYSRSKSLVPETAHESSFYDGLDRSLVGLADYPGEGQGFLRERLQVIVKQAETALACFRAEDPAQAAGPLLEALPLLQELEVAVAEEPLSEEARQALKMHLARKLKDFEEVTTQCLGLSLECLAGRARVSPGQRCIVTARLWNARQLPLEKVEFTPRLPNGWEIEEKIEEKIERETEGEVEAAGRKHAGDSAPQHEATFNVLISAAADLTCPYWLSMPRAGYRYRWPAAAPAAQPLDVPLVEVACEVSYGGRRLTLSRPAVLREAFAGGYRELPLAVVPPISLHPEVNREFLPLKSAPQYLEVQAVAHSQVEGTRVEGRVKLEAPPGWEVEPSERNLVLDYKGDSRTVRFGLTIPQTTPAGVYPLRYVVQCAGREYTVILSAVRMAAPGLPRLADEATCVREQLIAAPASGDIHLVGARFVPDLKYAYIRGADEDIVKALRHFGFDFHLVADDELGYIDLDQFDAIVVGPNAYLIRDQLRKNAYRLPAYVAQGGTLIVQYQGYGYQRDEFVPYPFEYNQPHDRVTSERAPVTILQPDHFLFRQPNVIGPADFEGWVHDRGLYFFGRWDKRYQALLASGDVGEEPKQGGLLLTSYGRGTYIYTGYSFFRQLPAGVAGAFRLFANLLAVPAARTLERARFLKNVPLFGFMDEEQLQAVARIMSERWVEDGVYLCHQGDQGDEMYLIVEGEVEIIKEAGGADRLLYLAKAGEAIGEMQVLSRRARAAAMRARGDGHLLVIQGEHFRALMHQYPDMSDRVIDTLVHKLAAAAE
jgi:LmbE family N-acetylglucosaminyl deacetylase